MALETAPCLLQTPAASIDRTSSSMSAARGPADIWQNLRRKLAAPRATVKVFGANYSAGRKRPRTRLCAQDMDPGLVRMCRLLKMFVVFAQVSWVRHRDVHLLTVATYTYTADQRFRAVHKPYYGDQAIHPDSMDTYQDWVLEIHSAQQRDSGIYECQISTTPHQSLFLHVRVVGTYTDKCSENPFT